MRKTINILIALVALLLPMTVCAQSRLFSDLSSEKNVHSVYISKTMLKLASGLVGNSVDTALSSSLNMGKIADNVSTIEVVTTEKKKGVKKIQKCLDKAIKTYSLQPLVDTPNGDANTQILYATDDVNGMVTKLLVVKKEKSQMQVVVIQGNINIEDIIGE
jgi:hypothetical protein